LFYFLITFFCKNSKTVFFWKYWNLKTVFFFFKSRFLYKPYCELNSRKHCPKFSCPLLSDATILLKGSIVHGELQSDFARFVQFSPSTSQSLQTAFHSCPVLIIFIVHVNFLTFLRHSHVTVNGLSNAVVLSVSDCHCITLPTELSSVSRPMTH
jgi:hypothetical protein